VVSLLGAIGKFNCGLSIEEDFGQKSRLFLENFIGNRVYIALKSLPNPRVAISLPYHYDIAARWLPYPQIWQP